MASDPTLPEIYHNKVADMPPKIFKPHSELTLTLNQMMDLSPGKIASSREIEPDKKSHYDKLKIISGKNNAKYVFDANLVINEEEECIDDWKDVQTNLGVVAALLLTSLYGRTGKESSVDPDTVWGNKTEVIQNIQTLIINLNFVVCLAATFMSAHTLVVLAMFPKKYSQKYIRRFGSALMFEWPWAASYMYVVFFLLDQMITSSLSVPKEWGIAIIVLNVLLGIFIILIGYFKIDKVGFNLVVLAGYATGEMKERTVSSNRLNLRRPWRIFSKKRLRRIVFQKKPIDKS